MRYAAATALPDDFTASDFVQFNAGATPSAFLKTSDGIIASYNTRCFQFLLFRRDGGARWREREPFAEPRPLLCSRAVKVSENCARRRGMLPRCEPAARSIRARPTRAGFAFQRSDAA